jgi:hypothetical protein
MAVLPTAGTVARSCSCLNWRGAERGRTSLSALEETGSGSTPLVIRSFSGTMRRAGRGSAREGRRAAARAPLRRRPPGRRGRSDLRLSAACRTRRARAGPSARLSSAAPRRWTSSDSSRGATAFSSVFAAPSSTCWSTRWRWSTSRALKSSGRSILAAIASSPASCRASRARGARGTRRARQPRRLEPGGVLPGRSLVRCACTISPPRAASFAAAGRASRAGSFARSAAPPEAALENALARLGAVHLYRRALASSRASNSNVSGRRSGTRSSSVHHAC